MLVGAPVAAAKVTLCVTPLVLFQVTVPAVWIVSDAGEKLLAPRVTVFGDGLGPGPGPGPGAVGPSPPPPHASTATTNIAPSDRERIAGIKVSSAIWFVGAGYRNGREAVLEDAPRLGRA